MANESDLREVSQKLETVIRLLAMDVIKGRDLKDQVRLLDQAGLTPRDIAEVLGKTRMRFGLPYSPKRRAKGTAT